MKHPQYKIWKDLIEEHLYDFLPAIDSKSKTLQESMVYSLKAGGKRLRPILLLAALDFCNSDVKQGLPYACAIEYIHTYSLIHDDLPAMDDDDLRRGIPTNHKVFGEGMAILAGDGLLSAAFEAMTKDMLLYMDDAEALKRRVRASHTLIKGAGVRGMVAGQVCDVEIEGKTCSKEMLDYIHLNKTAALIMAPIKAGAFLAGADEKKLMALTTYGECIGLAFQIMDDLLDVVGNEEDLGKRVGKDAQLQKATYPAIYGVEASYQRLEELTNKALDVMKPYYDQAEFFNELALYLMKRVG
ncbi:MAG: polyprenyl synthetase family protein [Clostridiales bacterium]|nr:polyprenyl synthetase family protein [Clostridiales bacterium]MBQ3107809.1 polyprenyl synthetase family protein [Bacillota bacterium]